MSSPSLVRWRSCAATGWSLSLVAFVGGIATASADIARADPANTSSYPASARPGWISVANTVKRSNCKAEGAPGKCTWFGAPLAPNRAVRPSARLALKKVFNFPISEAESARIELPPLLVQLLVHLSDTFAGAQICVVSGFRCFEQGGKPCSRYQKPTSRHLSGQAADITLLGVDNVDLATYVLHLDEAKGPFSRRLGVGYYPNQEHVHVDVRDAPKYWVDTSAPGEAPAYDKTTPHPMQAFFLHYDARRAPGRPGGQCPTLEPEAATSSEPDDDDAGYRVRSRNVFFTEPPLRGSPSSRALFRDKVVDFSVLRELEGLDHL